ncbi:hypothetical protein ACN4EK_28425 [Pantanalinema rosaneae CENA516]|uniref:hypothetical protein n=1 Tax=Pantanalinema rosaneae TaxID=1620701 RepID=UPI003D6FA0EC
MDWLKALWQSVAKDDLPTAAEVGFACALTLALWLAPSYIANMKPWERLLTYLMGIGVSATYVKRCQELQEQESYDRASRLMQQELAQHQIATEAAYYKQQLSSQFFPSPTYPPATEMPMGTTPQQQHAPLPPHRNLATEMVQLDGHVAMVSKTRSGKTTLLVRAIEESLAAGHQVLVLDGKGDKRLKAIPGIQYVHVNIPERVPNAFAALDEILDELTDRQEVPGQPHPTISVLIDEYNLILDACRDTGTGKKGEEVAKAFARRSKRILLQGAAEKVYLRATAHTSRVEDWGWNTGVLDSLSFLALGRNGALESLEDLLKYQITGKRAREFRVQLDALYELTIAEPIVLTTLAPAGFYRLPFYGHSPESPPNPSRIHSESNSDARTMLERCWQQDLSESNSPESPEFDSAHAPPSGENQPDAEAESPELEFPEIDGLEDMTLRSLILEYRQQGITGQNAFIKAFWDISAGESRRYLRARERYQSVCQRFGL